MEIYSCTGMPNLSAFTFIKLYGLTFFRFPEGKQHYDMLRTQERNSVAVLYQGPQVGFAPTVEKPTVLCEGKLCKAGKSGLAKSSSSFEVCFALKPLTRSMTEGKIIVPQTILEDSEDDLHYILYI